MTDGITMEQCDTIFGHCRVKSELGGTLRTLEACVVKCAGQSYCI